MIKYKGHNSFDLKKNSDENGKGDWPKSLTVQSFSEDADINVIMKRYGITGTMPTNPQIPMYGDFTDVKDYQSALNAIHYAMDGFMQLTPEVRAKFDNNPQALLEFMADNKNLDEAIKLGLCKEKPKEIKREPIEVIVTNPAGTPTGTTGRTA